MPIWANIIYRSAHGASAAAVAAASAAAAVPLAAGVEDEDDDDDQDPDIAVVKKIAKAVHFAHRRFRRAKASFFFSFGRLAPLFTEYAPASGSVNEKRRLFAVDGLSNKRGEGHIPDDILRDLARLLLPQIIRMYESEEGKKQLAEWKAGQEKQRESVAAEIKSEGS